MFGTMMDMMYLPEAACAYPGGGGAYGQCHPADYATSPYKMEFHPGAKPDYGFGRSCSYDGFMSYGPAASAAAAAMDYESAMMRIDPFARAKAGRAKGEVFLLDTNVFSIVL